MRPAFGIIRHVERRESNAQITERDGNSFTETRTLYAIMVTRVVLLWLTVWTHESEHPQ